MKTEYKHVRAEFLDGLTVKQEAAEKEIEDDNANSSTSVDS